jgi:hypothetical protein
MRKEYTLLTFTAVFTILIAFLFTGNGISIASGSYNPFPMLRSPDFDEVIPCDIPIVFKWNPPPSVDVYTYKFELFEDLDFPNQIAMALVDDTKYEYNGAIKCGQNYFWNVIGVEPLRGERSATWGFSTENAPPVSSGQDEPTLFFPVWVYYIITAVLFTILILGIWKLTRY